MVHPGGCLGFASPFGSLLTQRYPPWCSRLGPLPLSKQTGCYLAENGASGRIRTSDRSVRSRVLYPAELRMHRDYCFNDEKRKLLFTEDGASGRMTRLRLALRVVAEATLSSLVLAVRPATPEKTDLQVLRRIWCIREDSNLRPLGS